MTDIDEHDPAVSPSTQRKRAAKPTSETIGGENLLFSGVSISDLIDINLGAAMAVVPVLACKTSKNMDTFLKELENTPKEESFKDGFKTIWAETLLRSVRFGLSKDIAKLIQFGERKFGKNHVKTTAKSKFSGYTLLMWNSRPSGPERNRDVPGWKSGSAEIVDMLLDCGCPINETTSTGSGGMTALALAENPDVARRLVERGANIEKRAAPFCPTPIHAAIQQKNPQKIGLLLDAGASLDSVWECRDYGKKPVPATPCVLLARLESNSSSFDEMLYEFVKRGLGKMFLRQESDERIPPLDPKIKSRIEAVCLNSRTIDDDAAKTKIAKETV